MERSLEEEFCYKGDIVVVEFPYSNQQGSKIRPALIMGVTRLDLVIFIITSQTGRENEISLEKKDFIVGSLPNNPSFLRIDNITTIDKTLVKRKKAIVNDTKLDEITRKVIEFFSCPRVIVESRSKAIIRAKTKKNSTN